MKAAPITIKRFDPSTGELAPGVELVRADHFAPKLPRLPRLDESRISMVERKASIGPTGRSVIAMIDHREAEIEYWEAHSTCLSREEKRALLNGKSSLLRPIPPGWKVGDVIEVTNNVTAEVLEIDGGYRGYGIVLKVADFRPWYMKRIVGGSRKPKTDEQGYAAPVDKREEESARIDGSYTRSRALAVPDEEDADVMDDKIHQRLHAEASMKQAMAGSQNRRRTTLMELEQKRLDALKNHRRSTVRHLDRRIASLKSKTEKKAA